MSHLEDILLKTIELRKQGKNDEEIAGQLEITPEMLKTYESSARDLIFYGSRLRKITSFARKLGVPEAVALIVREHYLPAAGAHTNREPRGGLAKKIIDFVKSDKTKTQAEIAKILGTGQQYVSFVIKKYREGNHPIKKALVRSIDNSDKPRGLSKVEKVREAIRQGCFDAKELAKKGNTDRVYASIIRTIETGLSASELTLNRINALAEEGMSIYEIARTLNYSLSIVRKYKSNFSLDIQDEGEHLSETETKILGHKLKRKNKRLYRLIRRGLTLEAIAENFDITREGVRQKVNLTGQYDNWRRSRQGYDTKERLLRERQQVVGILNSEIEKRLFEMEKTDWAEAMATKYELSLKMKGAGGLEPISMEKLVNLFKRYEKVKRQGKKISYNELAQCAGFSAASFVRHILKRVGLKSMFWENPYKPRLTQEQRENITRASSFDVPISDIAYFAGISGTYAKIFCLDVERKSVKKGFGKGFGYERLSYRKASEIYEAQDLGFSREETSFLLDCNGKIVDYALANREEVGGKIIGVLRALRPNQDVNKPYLIRQTIS